MIETALHSANALWPGASPILSILAPFHRDDPRPLLDDLAACFDGVADRSVELVLIDDGTPGEDLFNKVSERLRAFPAPCLAIRLACNVGRASARNQLLRQARGGYFLLLDADMSPNAPDFLKRYLDVIADGEADMAFGGFTVARAPYTPKTAVHRAHSQRYDCLPARARGPQHVYTSNVLVRRAVMDVAPFDEAFVGWGWEDVDWGLRAQALSMRLVHIDNPATHMGLDDCDVLLRKSASAAANFQRLITKHPEASRRWPARQAAELLQKLPGHHFARPLLRAVVHDRAGLMPMAVRIWALKLWRASHAAQALK
jgi:glycosyltransferase involved in cell wall biosynthesis